MEPVDDKRRRFIITGILASAGIPLVLTAKEKDPEEFFLTEDGELVSLKTADMPEPTSKNAATTEEITQWIKRRK